MSWPEVTSKLAGGPHPRGLLEGVGAGVQEIAWQRTSPGHSGGDSIARRSSSRSVAGTSRNSNCPKYYLFSLLSAIRVLSIPTPYLCVCAYSLFPLYVRTYVYVHITYSWLCTQVYMIFLCFSCTYLRVCSNAIFLLYVLHTYVSVHLLYSCCMYYVKIQFSYYLYLCLCAYSLGLCA